MFLPACAADTFSVDQSVTNSIEEFSIFGGVASPQEPPLSELGEGRIYFNSTDNEFKVSENGGAYQPLGAGSNGDFSNGGDTTGVARSLGNNDNFDMSFLVGGNSELYIEGEAGASQGRIGLSDTSPEARLEISGNSSSEDLFMISSDDDNDGDILTIEDTGELGINGSASSISSSALFNVTDGSVLFTGSTGATPVSGAGVRMMWIPSKSAFRAGQSVSTEWDDANIGFGSISMGILTEASGVNSVAIGANSEATGSTSMALGQSSLATNVSSVAIGNATSSGQRSVAIGELVTAGPANDSYVIGRGISQAVQLVNNQQNTLAIGFNSNTPTLFIGASTGAGTTGNVGLGGITSPSTKLDMNGALTMRASSAPSETASRGHIYFDTADNKFKISENQSGFEDLIKEPLIAQFTDNTGGLDINQAGFIAVPWDTASSFNDSIYSFVGSEVTVGRTGVYKISYNISYSNATGRRNIRCGLRINGVTFPVPSGASYSYARNSTDDLGTNSATAFVDLSSGDFYEVVCNQGGSSGSVTTVSGADGQSYTSVEFIK